MLIKVTEITPAYSYDYVIAEVETETEFCDWLANQKTKLDKLGYVTELSEDNLVAYFRAAKFTYRLESH
jgi:hypothetical protein